MRVLMTCLMVGVFCCTPAPLGAQPGAVQAPDPVARLVGQLEQAVNSGDASGFPAFFGPAFPLADIERYRGDLFPPGVVRAVARERDRRPLEGAPPGDGYSLIVEFFIEQPGRGRILTAAVDVRRLPAGDVSTWRIVSITGLNTVQGLHKLRLNTAQAMAARQFQVTAEDLTLTLHDGIVFLVECDDGVTGLILIGHGDMRFSPPSGTERGQLRIYSGADELATSFDSAFIRMSPADYLERAATDALTPATPQARLVRQAEDIFQRESPRSFSVDLQDLSRDLWYLLPSSDDFMAEIDTDRFDTLTYSRSSLQAEDITLWDRRQRRTIALYPSTAKLAARGRFYSDDAVREFDVLDYNVETTIAPDTRTIQGRTRLSIRVRATYLSTVMLRLAEPLAVASVTSVEYGRLLHLRLRGQDAVVVNLPRPVQQDSDLTLVVTYEGQLPSQDIDSDVVQVANDQIRDSPDQPPDVFGTPEPSLLLSNRSFWYPQNPVQDYATATLRLTVPAGYRVVASGERSEGEAYVTLRDIMTSPTGRIFAFRARQPLRYLAAVVSRLTPVGEGLVTVVDDPSTSTGVDKVTISVEATRRLRSRGPELARTAQDIVQFFTTVVGDAPYTAMTIALLESKLPGGHSPGYFAVLNDPLPNTTVTWRGDPAAFLSFPEFFVAHELAHQWWGQAVGWKNYHEQWISEGFSQYFAALYAQHAKGDRTFHDMLRQFRRWALAESDQGPVHLGYRLGHIRGDQRVFRALVYNKGAAVLHMLRRLLGDTVFFAGIRRFYNDRRYQKAGTDDFERALEAESGLVLDRFFERWIYNAEIPRVAYKTSIRPSDVTVQFEQGAGPVFDFPVTVTLSYADGHTADIIVPVTDRMVERVIPVDGPVRHVQVNRDFGALAEFDERR